MKSFATLAVLFTLTALASAQTPALLPGDRPGQIPAGQQAGTVQPGEKLQSAAYDWTKLAAVPNAKGVRRALFDGPTTALDQLHCHITTLNPGTNSGEPHRHLQEEVIIVKEGLVEASVDGKLTTVGPGSVFFMAANAVTRLRNAGDKPCTYIVVYYYTPLTPKQ